jgi:hypothetical protein
MLGIDDDGPKLSTREMGEAHRTALTSASRAVEVSGYAESSEQAQQIILSDAVSLLTHSAWPAARPSPASLAYNPEIHYHVQFEAIFIQ